MKVAGLALEELTAIHQKLEGRKRGGTIVHYSFAVFAGTAYAVLTEYSPLRGVAAGTIYGAVLWFGADFIVLPLTKLSRPAPAYGWRVEGLSLAGHLAYGTVLEVVRKQIRQVL